MGKWLIFAAMEITVDDTLLSIEECAGSLKNVIDALYVLNGKWKLPLILSLVQSPKRFNEIQNVIGNISPKILSNELKHLELNNFVIRNVYPTTPVTIIYEATDYSKTLQNVMRELSAWGGQHREKLKQSMRE